MRKQYTTKFLLLLLVLFLKSSTVSIYCKNIALLLAVSNYPASSGYPNTVSVADAKKLKPQLENFGYEIIVLTDSFITKKQVYETIAKMSIAPGDYLVVVAGGHGHTYAGVDYFVPYNGSIKGDNADNISIQELFQKLCDKGAVMTVMFTDMCRTPSRGDPISPPKVNIQNPKTRSAHLIKACAINDKAYEQGGYGLLTKQLIDLLADPLRQSMADKNHSDTLSVGEVFDYIQQQMTIKNLQQSPQIETLIGKTSHILFFPLKKKSPRPLDTAKLASIIDESKKLKKYDKVITTRDLTTRKNFEYPEYNPEGLAEIQHGPKTFGAVFIHDDSLILSRKMLDYLFIHPSTAVMDLFNSSIPYEGVKLIYYNVRTHPSDMEKIFTENTAMNPAEQRKWFNTLLQGKVCAPAVILVSVGANGRIHTEKIIAGYRHSEDLIAEIQSAMPEHFKHFLVSKR